MPRVKINNEWHKIAALYFDAAGEVTQVTTASERPWGPFYDIPKKELQFVSLDVPPIQTTAEMKT